MKNQGNVSGRKASAFSKIFVLLLAAALLFCGCRKEPDDGDEVTEAAAPRPVPTAVLKAPFSEQDSLNPFFCASYMNAVLMPLCYESLFTVDTEGNVSPAAAGSYSETQDAAVVAIPTASCFSDGSSMTAEDIVYSYEAAKKSDLYRGALAGVERAEIVSPYEVSFTFTDRFPGRVGALTFPIVKKGTADSTADIPLGSGRYYCSSSEDGVFYRYSEQFKGDWGSVAEIDLVSAAEQEKLNYMLSSGEIDFYFTDLYGSRTARTTAQSVVCPQNNLVYLGFNSDSVFSDPSLRRAVSLAIDRTEVTGSVYSGNAEATNLPFRLGSRLVTQNYEGEVSAAVDYASASDMLRENGYDPANLKISLLVNAESDYKQQTAECVVSSLAQLGVTVTVRTLLYDRYIEALENGNYQMYIGEVKLPDSGAADVFFGGGAAGYGIGEDSAAASAYAALCDGSGSPASFIGSFLENAPFAPICFRNDVLYCRKGITVPQGNNITKNLADIALWQISADQNAD